MTKKIFDEYFSFSVSEKRSILIVSVLIIFGVLASFLIKHIPRKKEEFSAQQKSEIYELAAKLSETEKLEEIPENPHRKTSRELFMFDPNTASKANLEKLGFSDRQINTIQNYLNAGGKFYQKQDFKKIYNISEEEYVIYEPYIQIENSSAQIKPDESGKETELLVEENFSLDKAEEKLISVELNSASTNDLTLLKGIGEAYANRIVKFRALLGGFYKEEQLMEVYGISDTLFQQIMLQIKIDTSLIKTIDLNKALYKDLIKHPYLDSYYTKAILNYREFEKDKISKADLLNENILPEEVYKRVSHYLNP